MKHPIFFLAVLFLSYQLQAAGNDSTVLYPVPDSVKAVSYLATITVQSFMEKKELNAGIRTDQVTLALESDKNARSIVFEFPKTASVVSRGLNVETEGKGELEWEYDWLVNQNYKLFIAAAADSAANYVLYSGYIWLPVESKWKLIGTCKIQGQRHTIRKPSSFYSTGKKKPIQVGFTEAWVQRSNGSWKNLDGRQQLNPQVNLFSHIDSVEQFGIDEKIIRQSIEDGHWKLTEHPEGIFYRVVLEGKGNQVSVDDTVSAFYKLTLLHDTAIVDQARDKPATFPLNRLIKGWQIGVPLLKVGGKLILVIPSALAYSIRTRSPRIPPNS
ncbi:MAG TPA: FKBP-type peptidyl-prolyl cis-trans isomerase, partial [Chitinophagaceae bacterium]|nr:FKBP-type peptidyl-prolyl cis-trans isomerase [Chitinophagaceae bacterium]